MQIASTPKDTIFRDGTASLYRFRPKGDADALNIPFLMVPSMINRWYVLDLRPGASMAEAMVEANIDTYLLDWGIPNDEDRYLNWELIIKRLDRMVRRVKRETGAEKVALLGYCMGGTLSSIYTSLNPDNVAGFINLTGPIDFSEGGLLRTLVDEKWFNAFDMTAPGNLGPDQMQSGFTSLRPSAKVSKYVMLADRWTRPGFLDEFNAMETWANDNIAFPAEAYQTYISELYQQNLLYKGEHYVGGKHAHLSNITCPVLSVVATRDGICPPPAALVLNDEVSSEDVEVLEINGGHVGAVVGSRAPKFLYPGVASWLKERFGNNTPALAEAPRPEGLEALTVSQLRRELRGRDLPVSGNKQELVERLQADDDAKKEEE